MGLLSQNIAWYIDGGVIRCGVVVRKTDPSKEAQEQGAKSIYEFGHGYSTPQIFKTEKEANDELKKESK